MPEAIEKQSGSQGNQSGTGSNQQPEISSNEDTCFLLSYVSYLRLRILPIKEQSLFIVMITRLREKQC
jgi:hypothetical protein